MIETRRLLLRPWQESDAEALYAYAKDPAVGPAAGWPVHKSVEESRTVIREVFGGSECYAVCLKDTGAIVGAAELKLTGKTNLTDRSDECELGYWIGKPHWGRGYMPEAAKALLSRAFLELSMRAVWCGYYDGNEKSRRVQEKCGFVHHHTTEDVPVPLLQEIRTEHVNLLSKERWQELSPLWEESQ